VRLAIGTIFACWQVFTSIHLTRLEPGLDCCGPGRELVLELAQELVDPNCGLSVPFPNARNEVGEMPKCVIPYPSAGERFGAQQHRCAG
jgi:hypothetical protein